MGAGCGGGGGVYGNPVRVFLCFCLAFPSLLSNDMRTLTPAS